MGLFLYKNLFIGGINVKYLAKYNKVWKNVKTEKIYGNELELKDDEKLSDYKQVSKPVELQKQLKTNKQSIFEESKGVIK